MFGPFWVIYLQGREERNKGNIFLGLTLCTLGGFSTVENEIYLVVRT